MKTDHRTFDARFLIEYDGDPAQIVASLGNNHESVLGAVMLKNDGFGRLVPDGDSRQHFTTPPEEWPELGEITPAPAKPKRTKKPKRQSRADRWHEAVAAAKAILDKIDDLKSELADALSACNDVKSEYEEWKGNLPDNLQSGTLAEKLDEVCEIDFEAEIDTKEVEDALSTAESVDLPQGFGRD